MLKLALALSGALLAASTAQAQTTTIAPAPAAAAVIEGSSDQNVLRAGTQVQLRLLEELSTKKKKLRVGQRFQMEVAEPVTLNGQIVIPSGSPATGEVTDVRNKGMWGKSGRINARVLFLRVGGRQIRLTGQLDDKGTTGTAGVVASVAFVPVAGFFVTGTSAEIPVGAPVKGFLDEDITVAFASAAAPPPLVVGAGDSFGATAPAPVTTIPK